MVRVFQLRAASLSFDLDFKSCASCRLAWLPRSRSAVYPMKSEFREGCRERQLAYISSLRGVPRRPGCLAGARVSVLALVDNRASGTMAEGDNRSSNLLVSRSGQSVPGASGWASWPRWTTGAARPDPGTPCPSTQWRSLLLITNVLRGSCPISLGPCVRKCEKGAVAKRNLGNRLEPWAARGLV